MGECVRDEEDNGGQRLQVSQAVQGSLVVLRRVVTRGADLWVVWGDAALYDERWRAVTDERVI